MTKGGADQRVRLDVQVKPDAVRLDSWDTEGRVPQAFWHELGESVIVFLADTWGLDRRRQSGAWFEVKRFESAFRLHD